MNKITSFEQIGGKADGNNLQNHAHAVDIPAVAAVSDWPDPEPLPDRTKAEPYPVECLPEKIRGAFIEAQEQIKAPMALIACSGLSAMSLAIQSKVDVQRRPDLQSPVSLYTLVIAESGDRKSSADKAFTASIRSYQREVEERNKSMMKDYYCELSAWQAEKEGLERAIKQASASNKKEQIDKLKSVLKEVTRQEPAKPLNPDYLFENFSIERLRKDLKDWPSAGLFSAEGGAVFGSYGMKKDSVMDSMSTFNSLFSGESITFRRLTSESGTLHNCRLTISIGIQQGALDQFLSQSGGLARSCGYWARNLIACPETLQGYRQEPEETFFNERKCPQIARFNASIRAILEKPDRFFDDGTLNPEIMTLSAEARRVWLGYYNQVENELRPTGGLTDVRDFASKSAEVAVRIAALLEYFCSGQLVISSESMNTGALLAGWHLSEAQRYFNLIDRPEIEVDAEILEKWLISRVERNQATADTADFSTAALEKQFVGQYCPARLRKPGRLDAAIQFLVERRRMMITTGVHGKLTIHLNPKLIGSQA